MSIILDPLGYVDLLARFADRKYRLIPENAVRAMNCGKPHVEGLVDGLMDFASRMGLDFTVSNVSVWFDKMHAQQYLRTEMGAARIFVYYRPERRGYGVVEQIL